jgi:hypothetical protein
MIGPFTSRLKPDKIFYVRIQIRGDAHNLPYISLIYIKPETNDGLKQLIRKSQKESN